MARKLRDFLLLVVVVAGCVLLTLATSGRDYRNITTIYNFSFLGIMAVLYLIALFGGFFRMSDLSTYFRKAADKIDDMDESDGQNLEEKVRSVAFYRPLLPDIERFITDLKRSRSGICDIEDYVNEDETDSLVHKRLLDMVPDILTSLGILGTFMGLVWGLRAFQPSSYEAMTASVNSLVDGIKVAFLTSIYGLILSLVCSYSLRSGYQKMNDSLQRFLDRFHTRLVPTAEMEAQNMLVNNQKEQNQLIRSLTSEFSDQVAHGFAANMAPTLEKINSQLGDMMNTISHNQQVFLQDIVESFVKEMKASFHTEFNQFGDTVKALNDSMTRTMAHSEASYRKMSEDMRTVFSQDEAAMKAAVADISAAQKHIGDSIQLMMNQMNQIAKTYQSAQDTTLKNLAKSEQESSRFWVACNQAMQNYLKEAAHAYDRFEKANDASDKVLAAITATYQKNERILEDYQKRLRDFTEVQQRMSTSLAEIQRLFGQLEVAGSDGKTMYLYPGMSAQSKEYEKRILNRMESIVQESEDRQAETMERIRHEVKELNERTAKKRLFGR